MMLFVLLNLDTIILLLSKVQLFAINQALIFQRAKHGKEMM